MNNFYLILNYSFRHNNLCYYQQHDIIIPIHNYLYIVFVHLFHNTSINYHIHIHMLILLFLMDRYHNMFHFHIHIILEDIIYNIYFNMKLFRFDIMLHIIGLVYIYIIVILHMF